MAFPTVRSSRLTTITANSTSWTIVFPFESADIKDGGSDYYLAGDLILCLIGRDGSGTTNSISGYTELFNQLVNGSTAKGLVFAKVATGSEGNLTFSTTSEQGVARVIVVKDWYGTIANGVEVGGSVNGASTAPDPGSFSPSWGSAENRWTAFAAHDSGTVSINAFPSGFTDNPNGDTSGGGNGAGLGSASLNSATGTMDAGAFGLTASEQWVAATIAIRPQPPGPIAGTASITVTGEAIGGAKGKLQSQTVTDISVTGTGAIQGKLQAAGTTTIDLTTTATLSELPPTPVVLQVTSGKTAFGTSHNYNLPLTGATAGEIMFLFLAYDNTPGPTGIGTMGQPSMRGIGSSNGGNIGTQVYFRVIDGTETSPTSTQTTDISIEISYIAVRVSAGAIPIVFEREGDSSASVPNPVSIVGGNQSHGLLHLHLLALGSTTLPSSANPGYTEVASVNTATTDNKAVYIQQTRRTLAAQEAFNMGNINVSAVEHYMYSIGFYFPNTLTPAVLTEPFNNNARAWGKSLSWIFGALSSANETTHQKISQSFLGNGGKIKRLTAHFLQGTGKDITCVAKLYGHLGTLGTDSYPDEAGGVKATSDVINFNYANFSSTSRSAFHFTFPTPYQSSVDEQLVVVFEFTFNTTGHTVQICRAHAASNVDTGNASNWNGSVWTADPQNSPPWGVGTVYEYEAGGPMGSTTLTITSTGTLKGNTSLSGTAAIDVTGTATINGDAPIAGTTTATLDGTATLSSRVAAVGTTDILIDGTGVLSSRTTISGATNIDITATGALVGTGALQSQTVTDISLTATGTMATTVPIVGTTTIDITSTGTLGGKISAAGTTSITLDQTGTISGKIVAVGTTDITLTGTAILGAISSMSGSTLMTLTGTATPVIDGLLGSTTITLDGTATISATAQISGSTTILLDGTATVGGTTPIAGTTNISLTGTATGYLIASVSGATNISITGTAAISAKTQVIGTANVTIDSTGTIVAKGGLIGSTNILLFGNLLYNEPVDDEVYRTTMFNLAIFLSKKTTLRDYNKLILNGMDLVRYSRVLSEQTSKLTDTEEFTIDKKVDNLTLDINKTINL